jgi:hypothetical protein
MESVCHGAAIRRRGGVGDCVCAEGVGVLVIGSQKIHEGMD